MCRFGREDCDGERHHDSMLTGEGNYNVGQKLFSIIPFLGKYAYIQRLFEVATTFESILLVMFTRQRN
jgi:hypothetical protein